MDKSSIYNGVCWDKIHNKWVSKIVVDGNIIRLGYFDDEDIAYNTWVEYRNKHRPRQVVVDLDGEEWRQVQKFGDGYFVSNKGRVKNTNFKRTGDERILTLSEDGHGYYEVKRGKIHGKVHRLVLEAFIGKSELPVNHKDFNPKNNYLENLEYITQRENVTHSILRDKAHFGCCWDKYWNKWTAHIRIKGKSCYIGRFDSKEEAANAYLSKMLELGISNKYLGKQAS